MVGTRSDGSEGPIRKPTGWLTNNAALASLLARTFSDPSHDHVPLLDGRASKARGYSAQLREAILEVVASELREMGEINAVAGAGPVPEVEEEHVLPVPGGGEPGQEEE
eukprot:3934942-Pyramimonas_sp.AAC.1